MTAANSQPLPSRGKACATAAACRTNGSGPIGTSRCSQACILFPIWRSRYGRVEIGTEEDGGVGYYVSRTPSEESGEGNFQEHGREELGRVMSWLDEAPEEIRGEAVTARYSSVRPVAVEQAAREPRDDPSGSGGGSAG